MNRVRQRIQRYFFAPESPAALGYCRVAFCGWLFLFYLPIVDGYHSQDLSSFADVGAIFWRPVFPFSRLGLGALPHPWIDVVADLWKVLLFTSCVGFFTRTSLCGALVLGAYVIGLPYSFGKVSHSGGILVIVLGILALSRAGDAISVDAWWRRRQGAAAAAASGEYRWPIRFTWVLLATVYLCSSLCKWTISGLGYLDPGTMSSFLMHKYFAWYSRPLTDWGYTIAGLPLVTSMMSLGALVGETGFFLAVVSRRAWIVLVPALFLGHVGIAMLLGPRFFHFMAVYVFWVPWVPVMNRARGILSPTTQTPT